MAGVNDPVHGGLMRDLEAEWIRDDWVCAGCGVPIPREPHWRHAFKPLCPSCLAERRGRD